MRLTALIFIILVTLPAAAETRHLSGQKNLVLHLFNDRQFFHCISETGRLMQLDPDKERYHDYEYFILMNYYYGGQYLSIIESISRGDSLKEIPAAGFIYAYSLYNTGHKKKAAESLYNLDYSGIDPEFHDDLMFRRIDLLIESGQYSSALNELAYAEKYIDPEKTEELKRAISGFEDIRFRSPLIAGGLSAIIPGAGNIYAGSGFSSAALTFLAVTIPAALSVHSFRADNRKAGYAAGVFTAIFYAGGIYSASNTAARNNIRSHRDFRQEIKTQYIPEYDPQNYIDIRELLK